jgi:PAS domain-containing protein
LSTLRLVEETAQRTWAAVERAQAEAALLEREERLRLIVENARDYAIFTADSGGPDRYLAARCRRGFQPEQGHGGRAPDRHDLCAGGPGARRALNGACHRGQEGVAPNMRWHLRKDGSLVLIKAGLPFRLRSNLRRTYSKSVPVPA